MHLFHQKGKKNAYYVKGVDSQILTHQKRIVTLLNATQIRAEGCFK